MGDEARIRFGLPGRGQALDLRDIDTEFAEAGFQSEFRRHITASVPMSDG